MKTFEFFRNENLLEISNLSVEISLAMFMTLFVKFDIIFYD